MMMMLWSLLGPFRWLAVAALACVVVYGAGYLKGRQAAEQAHLLERLEYQDELARVRAELEAGELARAGEAAALEAALAREIADAEFQNDCPLDAADIARLRGQWRGGPR